MTAEANVIDLPVRFGGVTFDSKASVQIVINKTQMKPNQVEKTFCGRRLDIKAKAAKNGEADGQTHFEGMDASAEVDGSADAHTYNSTSEAWKTRLYFNLNDIDLELFFALRKKAGRLLIRGVAEIPEDEPTPEGADDEHEDAPGQRKLLDDDWRGLSLDVLSPYGLKPSMATALAGAGIGTLGGLAELTSSGKKLTDVKGIGPKMAEQIEAAAFGYHRDHPESEQVETEDEEE